MKRKSISENLRRMLMERQNNKCIYCNTELTLVNLEIDHFIPVKYVGDKRNNNLYASCSACNKKKWGYLFNTLEDVRIFVTTKGSKYFHKEKSFRKGGQVSVKKSCVKYERIDIRIKL